MAGSSNGDRIRLRGVRQNNLKGFDLDLIKNQLIVVTGLSGSGKSSLAFDTLYAEGQRRYIETFSPYARQFFDRMDKPRVDQIDGIPPAIAIEQRNSVKTTRSTVGTMTEICDFMKAVWPALSRIECPQCGRIVRRHAPPSIWKELRSPSDRPSTASEACMITFDLPLSARLEVDEMVQLIRKQGYQRILLDDEVLRLDQPDTVDRLKSIEVLESITVVQDRVRLAPNQRSRFIEACEQAYHYGKDRLAIQRPKSDASTGWESVPFSNRLHCAPCDREFREPTASLFSFNHPMGACPRCRGFGRIISIDYQRALPDRSLSIHDGVIKPWQTGHGTESQDDLVGMAKQRGIDLDTPFQDLPTADQEWVLRGDADYGQDKQHRWPHAWYGVKGYFDWLESKAYKMHVRVLLSRYRAYRPCPDCGGTRFQPDTLVYKAGPPTRSLHLAAFYELTVDEALSFLDDSTRSTKAGPNDSVSLALDEVRSRLGFLQEVGLGYLTLNRATRTLSGGETERVSLTSCIGTKLVNTLYVLDEPSVGLHPRDTERLIGILKRLRDTGNTVLVVEHDDQIIRAANEVIDLGPGHGDTGGELVFQGSPKAIQSFEPSLTGAYLSGRQQIQPPTRRAVSLPYPARARRSPPAQPAKASTPITEFLHVVGARKNNLKNLHVRIPLNRLVCLTGVSGSGKTTLLQEVLVPLLNQRWEMNASKSRTSADTLNQDEQPSGMLMTDAVDSAIGVLEGAEGLDHAVFVDQSSLGRTPRSNPAVYIGAFDAIRQWFGKSPAAREAGLHPGAFSFNSPAGQCEHCRGMGFEKIEMQFLSDVFIECPECHGNRYRPHVLDIRVPIGPSPRDSWNIADLLQASVDDALVRLKPLSETDRALIQAVRRLSLLQEVGLGYLRLGQPINTLSGGECQRLKLVRHLAEFSMKESRKTSGPPPRTLFLFDEPTTGLHFEDVRILLEAFQRLVDRGHSLLIVEHQLDVIRSADWVIDLGPESGDAGGAIVAEGPPEAIAKNRRSHTGRALRGSD